MGLAKVCCGSVRALEAEGRPCDRDRAADSELLRCAETGRTLTAKLKILIDAMGARRVRAREG